MPFPSPTESIHTKSSDIILANTGFKASWNEHLRNRSPQLTWNEHFQEEGGGGPCSSTEMPPLTIEMPAPRLSTEVPPPEGFNEPIAPLRGMPAGLILNP
jgi:hypothetical protein